VIVLNNDGAARQPTPAEHTEAPVEALALGGPALVDCIIDPTAGKEAGT
jgi:oxalyl-CoA decarboxylase